MPIFYRRENSTFPTLKHFVSWAALKTRLRRWPCSYSDLFSGQVSGQGAHDRKWNCNLVSHRAFQHHPAGGSVRFSHWKIPSHGVCFRWGSLWCNSSWHQVHWERCQGYDQRLSKCLTGTSAKNLFVWSSVNFMFQYLHDRMICHRDIKPENLLVIDMLHSKVRRF